MLRAVVRFSLNSVVGMSVSLILQFLAFTGPMEQMNGLDVLFVLRDLNYLDSPLLWEMFGQHLLHRVHLLLSGLL